MLVLHARSGETREPPADLQAAPLPRDVVWIDLQKPDSDEIAFVERATGLRLPDFEALSEIESSSRLRQQDDVLYLSAPLVHRAIAEQPAATPVGFVLTPVLLVTVRFEPLTAFSTFAPTAQGTAPEVFIGLVEAIVDRVADVLEHIAAELDNLSHRLFRAGRIDPTQRGNRRRPARETADLRVILRRVGASGDLASKIRDSLLGLGRIVPYVATLEADRLPELVRHRLETMRHDIASLSDYDAHILNKVQLLLDATLGLINIEQNDIIKVLTVVSVVGVPPTLIASMYGMNFQYMPELHWSWGYPYGLVLIAISAVAPLLWFKWRGWF
ncbi:MAG TPA: magnesium transporter CorA family protein [Stellaceae bacterium]|nr:magnesium transporter CorA family protein [Stellaceae bacterium]